MYWITFALSNLFCNAPIDPLPEVVAVVVVATVLNSTSSFHNTLSLSLSPLFQNGKSRWQESFSLCNNALNEWTITVYMLGCVFSSSFISIFYTTIITGIFCTPLIISCMANLFLFIFLFSFWSNIITPNSNNNNLIIQNLNTEKMSVYNLWYGGINFPFSISIPLIFFFLRFQTTIFLLFFSLTGFRFSVKDFLFMRPDFCFWTFVLFFILFSGKTIFSSLKSNWLQLVRI